MTETVEHGGKREGAGRPRGSINRRTAEALEQLAEQFPDWTPLAHLAAVANDDSLDIEIRLDAAKAAAPYVHARLKPVVANADELVELEARLVRARIEAQADVLDDRPGLADRLERARRTIIVTSAVPRAPDDPLIEEIEAVAASLETRPPEPSPASSACLVPSGQVDDATEDAGVRIPAPPSPVQYRPILPSIERQAHADVEYDPTADD